MLHAIARVLAWPLRALVCLYRITLSPWLGANCRYSPTCSEYALEALREYGAFRGCWLAARRIGRCHPWGGSGYDPVPEKVAVDAALLQARARVLNHAYGFISRDNRAGGFRHIEDWLHQDPAPQHAWEWFFQQLLGWEVKEPALEFAQIYLTRLLQDGDYAAAVKVMLRCRLEHETFLPLPQDRELARAAAEHCGNDELTRAL